MVARMFCALTLFISVFSFLAAISQLFTGVPGSRFFSSRFLDISRNYFVFLEMFGGVLCGFGISRNQFSSENCLKIQCVEISRNHFCVKRSLEISRDVFRVSRKFARLACVSRNYVRLVACLAGNHSGGFCPGQ